MEWVVCGRRGRVATSDPTSTIGCPIFATVLSSIRWTIFAAAKIPTFLAHMPSDLKWSPRTSFGVVKRYQKATTFITFTQSQSIENKNLFGSLKTKAKSLVKSQNYLMQ
jgi:hypothetical protein